MLVGAVIAGRVPLEWAWAVGVLLTGGVAIASGVFGLRTVAGRVAIAVGLVLAMWGWAGIRADSHEGKPVGEWAAAVRRGEIGMGPQLISGRAISVRWAEDYGGLQRLVMLDSLAVDGVPISGQGCGGHRLGGSGHRPRLSGPQAIAGSIHFAQSGIRSCFALRAVAVAGDADAAADLVDPPGGGQMA